MLAIHEFRPSVRAALLALGLASFPLLGQAVDQPPPAEGTAPKAETPSAGETAPATEGAAAKAPASKEAAPAKSKAKASAHKAKKKKRTRAKAKSTLSGNCGQCTANGSPVGCNKNTQKWTCATSANRCDTPCI